MIGGLRPHFYDVCKPNISTGGSQTGIGFSGIMYDRSVCTGDEDDINDSLGLCSTFFLKKSQNGSVYLKRA